MIKRVLLFSVITIIFTSCGTSVSSDNTATGSLDVKDLEASKEAFIDCKNTSTESHACKEFVATAFASYYGYKLMNADEYLPYDEILATISESSDWQELGSASDQNVLNEAQENANQGIGTLAVNTKGTKSVAIIIKGELSHSNSLGLDCPNVLVFRPRIFNKSFVGKGINYAWSDLSDVKIYSLK
ncbi:MAG: hypothetical protein ACJAZ2_000904 [Glaciecola sp.]|jgi:hypothetical protein